MKVEYRRVAVIVLYTALLAFVTKRPNESPLPLLLVLVLVPVITRLAPIVRTV